MNQVRDDETTGDELFMEELGQIHGGQAQAEPHLMPSVGRTDIEHGVKPPVKPPGKPIYTTQALGEEGVTPPHSQV